MKLRTLFTGLFAVVIFTHAWAGGREARPFDELNPPQPTKTGDKTEVVEVFWYGCPHCYSLEPYLEQWLKTKPDDVEFRRIPGVLGKKGKKEDELKRFYKSEDVTKKKKEAFIAGQGYKLPGVPAIIINGKYR